MQVDLSDIGKSLVAIETEIKSNNNSIKYYEEQIAQLHEKNAALQAVVHALINNYKETIR